MREPAAGAEYQVCLVARFWGSLLPSAMKLRAVLAANLRMLRSERKLSQDHLSEACGLTRNYVGSLEREEYAASIDALEKLAAALKVQPSQLLEKRLGRAGRPGKSG